MAPPGLSDVPAPWQLHGEAYVFMSWSWTPVLPEGSFHASEEAAIRADSKSKLHKTPYALMLFRYKSSPAGPYDEIIYVPGYFRTAVKDDRGKVSTVDLTRIARIYVSTDASVYNGRKNWNVPKHRADFDFQYHPDGSVDVRISLPNSSTPFFAAKVTPSKWVPRFPISTAWMPGDNGLLLPPLPHVSDVETGTQDWLKTPYLITSQKAQLAYITPLLNGGTSFADGVSFPDIPKVYTGVAAKEADIDFMKPLKVNVVDLPSQGVKRD